MAISFNSSSPASADSGASQVASQAITIPAGVLAGDIVFLACEGLAASAATPGFSVTTTGTAWQQIGTTQSIINGGFGNSAAVFYIEAAAGDIGLGITVNSTGVNSFMSLAMASWTGASGSQPDVQGGTATAAVSSVTLPSETTGVSGDWAIYLCGAVVESGVFNGPSGATSRVNHLSGSDVGAAIYDSNGSVGGSGSSIGGGTFSASSTSSWWGAFTVGLQPPGAGITGTASLHLPARSVAATGGPFNPNSPTTDGNGVVTWQITSPINGGDSETIRVLQPTSPAANYPHSFLFTLPVASGSDDTSFGDGLDTVRVLGLHNSLNLTVVEASFSIPPWYADNPVNAACQQESYLLEVVNWAPVNYAISHTEKNYLIGFSKSGLGGQSLQYRHPGVFAATASWDFPGQMTGYDGTDPNGPVGGGSADVYGTAANFTNNYELSSANLTAWRNASNFGTVNRLWIGGWFDFQADVSGYHSLLVSLGIQHTYAAVAASEHNWAPSPEWVPVALDAIIPATPVTGTASLHLPARSVAAAGQLGSNITGTASLALPARRISASSGKGLSQALLGGTITGGIVGVQADQQAIVNNDAYFYLAITYNGSALNLAGYTVKAYLKANRLTPDSEAAVFTTGSGLTITNAADGLVTWDIPHADLPNPTTQWYRVDVIDASSEVFTALFGNLQVLPA